MDMDFYRPILSGTLCALLFAGSVLAVAWRPWRRGVSTLGGVWSGPLATGGGFIAGAAAFANWRWPPFPFPPIDAIDRLFWLTWPALAVGLVDALWPWRSGPRWAIRSLVLVTAWVYLLHAKIKKRLGTE